MDLETYEQFENHRIVPDGLELFNRVCDHTVSDDCECPNDLVIFEIEKRMFNELDIQYRKAMEF